MRRGTKPKSAAQRVAEGCRAHRPLPDEVQPAGGKILPPPYVKRHDATMAEWETILADCVPMGFIRPCDRHMIGRLAALRVQWEAALEKCRNGLDTITTKRPDGGVKAVSGSPWAMEVHRLAGLIERLETSLGLSPTARTQLAAAGIGPPKEENPLHAFGITE